MKKLWLMFLVLNLAAILAVAGGAGAATYYVDALKGRDKNKGTSLNSPWKTLNKINNSSFLPSDKILFKRGQSWVGKIVVPSSGSKNQPITIGDYGTGNKPVINGSNNYAVLLNGKNFITLQNLEIINKQGQGLIITKSTDNGLIIVDSCDIHNNLYNGITLEDRGNAVIINCRIYSNKKCGISVYYTNSTGSWNDIKGDNMRILNNDIHNNGTHGAYLAGDNAIIQHNTIYANGSDSLSHNMYLIGDDSLVESNTFKDACYGLGFRYEGSNMIFRYNLLNANHKHGLGFWNDFPNVMSNNKAYYNIFIVKNNPGSSSSLSMAIFVGKSSGAGIFDGIEIYNNSIYAPDDNAGGIWLDGCDNINVKNNILKTGNCRLIHKESPAINLKSDYNIFTSTGVLPIYGGSRDINFHDWQALGYDYHSFFTEPMFVSPAPETDSDFALGANSCAIRAGINLSLNRDYIGTPVPDQPDIGALQYK